MKTIAIAPMKKNQEYTEKKHPPFVVIPVSSYSKNLKTRREKKPFYYIPADKIRGN